MSNVLKMAMLLGPLVACSSPECRIERSTDGEQDCTYTYSDVRSPEGALMNPYPLPFKQTFLLSSKECTEQGEPEARLVNYTYNDAGQLLSQRVVEGGSEYLTLTYTYDGDGRLTQRDQIWAESLDENDVSFSYTHDDQGRVLTEDDSSNQMRFTYDSEGRVQQTEYDIEANGTVNYRRTFVYNDEGHLLRVDVDNGLSLDEGVDGTIDETRTFTTVCD